MDACIAHPGLPATTEFSLNLADPNSHPHTTLASIPLCAQCSELLALMDTPMAITAAEQILETWRDFATQKAMQLQADHTELPR